MTLKLSYLSCLFLDSFWGNILNVLQLVSQRNFNAILCKNASSVAASDRRVFRMETVYSQSRFYLSGKFHRTVERSKSLSMRLEEVRLFFGISEFYILSSRTTVLISKQVEWLGYKNLQCLWRVVHLLLFSCKLLLGCLKKGNEFARGAAVELCSQKRPQETPGGFLGAFLGAEFHSTTCAQICALFSEVSRCLWCRLQRIIFRTFEKYR